MRMASFFLLSAAVHAAALSFPVSFLEIRNERVIPVVLLGGERKGGPALDRGTGGKKGEKKMSAPIQQQHDARAQKEEGQNLPAISGVEESTIERDRAPQITPDPSGGEVVLVELAGGGWEKGASVSGELSKGVSARPAVSGIFGAGAGSGDAGLGGAPDGSTLGPASYAYNPKPAYPEAARREGWEGTVVLRVLVDRDGRSKFIELNRSSGFEALDQAAIESVKVWRFHPARHGKIAVESWVKIPVVFSLSERDRGS